MIADSRKSLNFKYHFLNLVSEVSSGGAVKARYTWLADGTKLRVRDASGSGFDYLGSLTYTGSGSGLQLEFANFAGGTIRSADGSGSATSQEINYFLTDHLGSVRVIVDGSGGVLERNDYYAFGAKHVRPDYPQTTNRYRYNGKELQTTGGLNYLDYGARMYDAALGRWFSVDPLAEETVDISPYAYCYNNPVNLIDIFGLYAEGPDKIYDGGWIEPVIVTPKGPYLSLYDIMYGYGRGGNSASGYEIDFERLAKDLAEISNQLSQLKDNRSWGRRMIDDYAPVWSFSVLADQAWNRGEYWTFALCMVAGIADGLTLGGISTGAKVVGKQGAKIALKNVAKGGVQYTKSSLKLGQQMHAGYKTGLADGVTTFKEFTGIKGIRPDFVDFGTKTIYELKPFNPRSIQLGTKQLNNYKSIFEVEYPGTIWKTVLDHY